MSARESLYRSERVAAERIAAERIDDVLLGPSGINAESVAAYHQNGFLAVERVLSPDEVASARSALDDLLCGRVSGFGFTSGGEPGLQPEESFRSADAWEQVPTRQRPDRVRKIWRFVDFAPRLRALATEHAKIRAILAGLLAEESWLIQDMALIKPPHIGGEKPWHQDMAYFGWGPPERVVGVWIALDAATVENGCMQVLPGTHQEGAVPHVHDRDCQIPDDRVDAARAVAVPLAPGGALFFSSLLHHGTPPNRSPNRRWALQFHYAGVSCTRMDRRAHADLFFEEDRYAGCQGEMGTPITDLTP